MNRFALVTFYRSLVRHKLYAALNIGGLAVGIAVFVVLGLYVRFETSYERWLPNHDQVYIVQDHWNLPGQFEAPIQVTMGDWLPELKRDYPEARGARVHDLSATVQRGGVATAERIEMVDPELLDIIELPVVRGQTRGLFDDPANLAISEAMAAKYFPGADALGKPMTITVTGHTKVYRIMAILKDLPKNTEFKFDFAARLIPEDIGSPNWARWGSEELQTFLRFPTPEAAHAFEGRFDDFIGRHGKHDIGANVLDLLHESLLPLADIHLDTAKGAKLTVVTLGLVGLLTLLIAIVNYVNLATARASLRAREVGMRKVLGADRKTLMLHFVGEAIATAALAAFVGLALAEITLPLVNAAGNLTLSIHYIGAGGVLLPLVLLVILVGIAAGLYPAVLLSRFPAAGVLAASRSAGGGRGGTRVREVLVIFQFALATAFIVGTLVLAAQTRHVREADLGFARDGLIMVPSFPEDGLSESQRASLLAAFSEIPGVKAVGTSNTTPGDKRQQNHPNVRMPGMADHGPSFLQITVGPGFFQAYRPALLAGRLPDDAHGEDDVAGKPKNAMQSMVISREGAKVLGFTPAQAVGRHVTADGGPRTIIGVVEDMRFYSPREEKHATYYSYASHYVAQPDASHFPIAAVRFDGDPRRIVEGLRAAWRRIAPEVPFEAKTTQQSLALYYESDDQAGRLFAIGAGLAVAIGCVGLWGLASFNTQRRVREIGIRKTLGASSRDIVKLLVTQFLRPVVIGNLIAWPLAFLAMRTWLAGFEDRITLSPLYFVAATAASLLIAVATVIAQSLRAARAAPAWALRHE